MSREAEGIGRYSQANRAGVPAQPAVQRVAPIAVPIRVTVDQERQPRGHRPRIPTMEALSRLIVNGLLKLPERYRPGWFLDIYV